MTQEQVEFVKKACDWCEIECTVRPGYSGRRMYGKETFGVVVPSVTDVIGAVVGYMKSLDDMELHEAPQLDDLQMDNTGKDLILY